MEALDKLKRDWQQRDHGFPKLSAQDLHLMLHRKSSSIVKWILVVSVLEFIFWLSLAFLYNLDDFTASVKRQNLGFTFDVVTYLNYAIIFTFIYLFYKNYRRISIISSTQNLMQQILQTRKTVNYYVYYNLILVALSFLFGLYVALQESNEIHQLKQDVDNVLLLQVILLLVILVFLAVLLGAMWLFYKIIYGILLKRLYKNYEELKKNTQ